MMPVDDDVGQQRVLAGVAAGERHALTLLYDTYGPALFAFGVRRLGDRELAEELVQQVVVNVWRRADHYDPSRGSVRTWVFAIARNVAVDLHRRRRREGATRELEEADDIAASDELDRLLRAEAVRNALERLSPEHRRVLELAYFRGLDQAETASRLGLPVGTVKSRTYYGLRALRLTLNELGVRS